MNLIHVKKSIENSRLMSFPQSPATYPQKALRNRKVIPVLSTGYPLQAANVSLVSFTFRP